MHTLYVSESAQRELRNIMDYTKTQWGDSQKERLKTRIANTMQNICLFPSASTRTDRRGLRATRVARTPLILLFTSTRSTVSIVQILHDRQNRLAH